MGSKFYQNGNLSGFQYENKPDANQNNNSLGRSSEIRSADEDLVIEENTVYEIDRDCYERFKKQRKRKTSDKKNA